MGGWLAGEIGWLALAAILGPTRILFHPDIACDRVFQRQFNFIGKNHRHWPLLQHPQQARFGQPVSDQLLPLQGVDFIAEFGQANLLAGRDEGEGQAGRMGFIVFGVHVQDQIACNTMLNRPPIRKAKGTITATMARATLLPCSLTIIIRLAKQGMNSVMVIMPTTA